MLSTFNYPVADYYLIIKKIVSQGIFKVKNIQHGAHNYKFIPFSEESLSLFC
ncbi:hypothetical protein AR1Y2_0039 [Anaerostipes rhamnosivorans]|uniref:Uncharacterized protein n=1 Tax=Anaerostipes rhamnosivorans TaxID=1229621 RepID=A0A4P8ICR2_9FIRM|nr:hypothetical protein AR1Y2_0039 [Anaerostipes rhamnosivorans]